jgi:hypothetical protein
VSSFLIIPANVRSGCAESAEERGGTSVVAEGLVEMNEEVAITGGKDETGAELEGILAEAMLTMASSSGARARPSVITP